MTTTDVMERENIGSLVRKLFFGLAGAGIVAAGITGAVAMFSRNETPQKRPAITMQAKEKSDKYKALAQKYAVQVEAGRKYVAEKYGLSLEQVEVEVLDEIRPGYGPLDYNGPATVHVNGRFSYNQEFLPKAEKGLFVAYASSNGYTSVVISQDIRIQDIINFPFCGREIRDVIESFLRSSDNQEVAILDVQKGELSDIRLRSIQGTKPPKTDKVYDVYFTSGWGYRRTENKSYAFDVGANEILGEISPGVRILGEPCE